MGLVTVGAGRKASARTGAIPVVLTPRQAATLSLLFVTELAPRY